MSINKDKPQVETLVMDGDRVALCRCWQSSKFPFCDGAHNAYNEANGDQLGPVIVCKASPDDVQG